MTPGAAKESFAARVRARAALAGVTVPEPAVAQLEAYVQLLSRWNRAINLTSLPLDPLDDRAIDRLLVEPLTAAGYLADLPGTAWFDLGSGGGSPAVPLALMRPELHLTMVEVRERKAAFLREVVRELRLAADVAAEPFEGLPDWAAGRVALVTVRAVKTDDVLWQTVTALLMPAGQFVQFAGTGAQPPAAPGFEALGAVRLTESGTLLRWRYVPRGTVR